MARGEPDSDAVQPPTAYGSGSCTPSQTACRYSNNAAMGDDYLYTEANKITPLMICICGLITFRGKPLFEEPLFSHLPAFCCGTSILLMCLPLRLDAGSRRNHLQPRYGWRKAAISAFFDLNWMSDEMRLMGWYTLFWNTRKKLHAFWRNEDIYSIWKHWNCHLAVSCLYIFFQAAFHHHRF